jgi:hypothetical protein
MYNHLSVGYTIHDFACQLSMSHAKVWAQILLVAVIDYLRVQVKSHSSNTFWHVKKSVAYSVGKPK